MFEALGEGKEGVSQVVHSCGTERVPGPGAPRRSDGVKKRDKHISGVGEDKVRGVGLAVAMQGSGIPLIDMAAASMKMNEDGSLNLYVGATDIGTGSDTILAQIAAEVLRFPIQKIIVLSSDTDLTPFDVGAYASSTTYVSGQAVKACAEKIADPDPGHRVRTCWRETRRTCASSEGGQGPGRANALSLEEIATSATYNRRSVPDPGPGLLHLRAVAAAVHRPVRRGGGGYPDRPSRGGASSSVRRRLRPCRSTRHLRKDRSRGPWSTASATPCGRSTATTRTAA